ncbi:uncharacterized protein LOC120118557 [Hibiscus syriacus]|uniref:uncharacterized protein LOC120118557 n=1 Tax=Hibiscus syriacus TaxID=106335 RepID=UPI0019246340|nr:uncharacterized protein LOC120118557 [Hibiscus syriacus]
MARVSCKHILLVAFFIFIFISKTATARNMPVDKKPQKVFHDDQVHTATEIHGEDHVKVDELVSMDYTPATRKPPIHN